MENPGNKIRFIHVFDKNQPLERASTIAYTRTEEYVAFAWADKRPGEEYVKSIGREYSAARLNELLQYEDFTSLYGSGENYIDVESMQGILHVDFLHETVTALNTWSDPFVARMNWFDLKHVALSQLILSVVGNSVK